MKKLFLLVSILVSGLVSGCSTVQSGMESPPYYEPTTEGQKVDHTVEHARTAQMMV